eukprot:SAG22_NODE_3098_length_1944_cov_2.275339_2_plen_373_part_00
MYRIQVQTAKPPGSWVVAKRFSDFVALRESMRLVESRNKGLVSKLPFPAKTWTSGGGMAEATVQARHQLLDQWLEAVVAQHRNAVALLAFLEDDGSENSLVDLLAARSYLRGSNTLQLDKPLTQIGWRTARQKSCYLLAERQKRQKVFLTMLTIDAANGRVAVSPSVSKEHIRHIRSFLMELEHPFVATATEIGFIKDRHKVLVFRSMMTRGSLRDLLHRQVNPLQRAQLKYPGGTGAGRRQKVAAGQPLNERRLGIFGRQILEAVGYVTAAGLRCGSHTVHSGNFLLQQPEWCVFSDFENEVFGLGGPDKDGADAGADAEPIRAFGLLMYELATAQVLGPAEAFVMPACPLAIQQALDFIFSQPADGKGEP